MVNKLLPYNITNSIIDDNFSDPNYQVQNANKETFLNNLQARKTKTFNTYNKKFKNNNNLAFGGKKMMNHHCIETFSSIGLLYGINKKIVYKKDLGSGNYIQLTPASVDLIYIYKEIIYGRGLDNYIYTIPISGGDNWKLLSSSCCVKYFTIYLDNIYCIGLGNKVWKRPINGTWKNITPGSVKQIFLYKDLIYAIGMDNYIYTISINGGSIWQQMDNSCCVTSIYIDNDVIYGIGTNGSIYKKFMSGRWIRITNDNVVKISQIIIINDILYGLANNKKVYQASTSAGDINKNLWVEIPNSGSIDYFFIYTPSGDSGNCKSGSLPIPSYSFDFRNQINNVSDEMNTNIKLNPINNPVFNKDSVQFNGNGQYMKSSDKLPIGNNSDFSIEFYLNYTPSGSNNIRTIFQLISEENNSFNIELSNMNQTYSEIRLSNGSVWKGNLPETTLAYKTNNSAPNAEDYSPGTPLTTAILPNTLVHYVLTISNNKVILYRNGSSYFEKNGNNLSVKNLNRYIYIAKGMKESGLSSNMKMYFFRIFNQAISPENIIKLYDKKDTMNLFRNCSPATYANAVNKKISDFDLWGVNSNDNIFKFGDNQNSWKQIGGSLKNVSASGKDYIWGANKNDDIYTCLKPCDDAKWTHVPGKLKQVSADDEYIWGVNSGNYIYRKKVNNSDNWKNISGSLSNISSTGKDYLWGTNTLQQIFKCKKPCDTGQWEVVNGGLRQVSGGEHDVWGVNSNNQLYKRPVDGSGNWKEIGGGKFKWVSGSNEDFIYAIDAEDKIYKCAQPCDNKSGNWMVIPGSLKQLDASKNVKKNEIDSLSCDSSVYNDATALYDFTKITKNSSGLNIVSDMTGKTGDLTLYGGASPNSSGLLISSSNGNARSEPSQSKIDLTSNRSLVAWVTLKNLNIRAGSPIAINSSTGDQAFDAIDWAEKETGKWMHGSDYFKRTCPTPTKVPVLAQTGIKQCVIITQSFVNNKVETKTYINGKLENTCQTDNPYTYKAGKWMAVVGPRLWISSGQAGWLSGIVHSAAIFNKTLTQSDVMKIYNCGSTGFKIQPQVQNCPDKSISDADKNKIINNSKNKIENSLLGAISNINSSEINFPIKKNDLGLNYNMNFTSREFFQNQNDETLNMANIQDKIKELEEKKNVQSNQLKEISNKEKLNSKYSTLLKISQDRNGFKRKIIYSLIASVSFVFIIILLMFVFYTRKLV